MASPTSYFECLPTRDPSQVSFRVPVDAKTLTTQNLPAQYTAYKDTNLPGTARVQDDGFQNYVYTYNQKEGGLIWFYFAKPKTDAERRIPFNTFYTSRQWRWPTVLNSLIFIPDPNFPVATLFPIPPDLTNPGGTGTAFSPTMIQRMNVTPEALALSMCKVEQFVSDRPWNANELTHQQPTEAVVSWDFPGAQGSITCLHSDIKIQARNNSYTTVIDSVTSSDAAPYVPERIFPATNFEDWEPFAVSDDVVRESGVYFRELITIYPPEQNEPSVI